jgi:hypothetical protein
MKLDNLILVTPSKPDVERDAVAQAWLDGGGTVERLDRFWEPPGYLDRNLVRLYGNDTFCLVVAQKLNLALLSPDERILASAPDFLVKRRVSLAQLAVLEPGVFPVFVKPVVPKQFRAAVYASLAELERECRGLEKNTEILVSDIVRLHAEARAFMLDSVIRTVSVYQGAGNDDQAAYFAERVIQALELPRTCVVDVGLIDDGTWVFIEANATWGAGLNGCNATAAAACVAAATEAV